MNAPRKPVPWAAVGLVLALVCVYLPSVLRGEFLNYDDTWLIVENPVLHDARPGALVTIWSDLSLRTRLLLGAEFLPVRDTVAWLQARAVGFSPVGFRACSLGLYILAALLVRSYVRTLLGATLAAEAAAFLFALHPVHAESVAWLAGQKDLLALLFVALALRAYAREDAPRRAVWVPVFIALACLSKAVAVVTPALLLVHDAWVRRRPAVAVQLPAWAVALGAVALHARVGAAVGMVAPPLGATRLASFVSMGPVWWRYLARCVAPVGLSVVYEVPARSAADPFGWLCVAALALVVGASAWRLSTDRRPLLLWAWFFACLAPTAQFLVPLQNVMADRYLLLAVLAPCVGLASALEALSARRNRPARALALGLVAAFSVGALLRGRVFADNLSLWHDAIAKTHTRALAPFQLGQHHLARGENALAERWFRVAFARPGADHCGAASQLSRLMAQRGATDDAVRLLEGAPTCTRTNPRALNNLAELLARQGRAAEARARYDELIHRFPTYAQGRENYQRRYGPPPR